jgi:3-hydroxy-D-aspartate aldolase
MTDEQLHSDLIGRAGSRTELNTPVLVVELDALQRNIARMAAFARQQQIALRPHAKTHKSPEIAKLQMEAGAIGICCAKLGEAEVLAEHGVRQGLHITSPVVSVSAIRRLIALNARTQDLMCVVDHPANARALGVAARVSGQALNVLIDIDPGIRRTGVGTCEAAVALLRTIQDEPFLNYLGVQYYCGVQQHIQNYAERRAVIEDRTAFCRSVIEALSEIGGAPKIVTGGGTGTHRIDAEFKLFTELQVGSYVFMDRQYLACDLTGTNEEVPFETALLVEARVISANTPGMVTIDAGLKSFSTDADVPVVVAGAANGATYKFMGDEHGALMLTPEDKLALADIVTLSAPHCDPTVNLYDTYHVVQGDTLRALWPIAARGKSR